MFRSQLEEKVSDLLCELGIDYEYEPTKVPYQIQHNYSPDFLLNNGIYLETKGYWDAADRRKMKAVKEQNPDLDIRMVFQAPFNTISKKSKTTYAKYCERIKIPWTSWHNIPMEWLIQRASSKGIFHAMYAVHQMEHHSILMDIHIALYANTIPQLQARNITITKCLLMYKSKVQPKGCKNEVSQRRRAKNIKSTEKENFYATITSQAMEYFKAQK